MTLLIEAGVAIPDVMLPPQTDFAVCVDGNRIVAAGTKTELRAQFPEAERFGDDDLLLMPAFTNSHDHGRALGSASLGVPDDLLEIWLPLLGSQPGIPPYLAAAYESIQLFKAGVSLTAHSHNPLRWEDLHAESHESLRGYREAGLRVAFHPPLVDQNALVYAEPDRFLATLPAALQADARQMMQQPPISHADYLGMCADLYGKYHDATDHTVHIQISPAGGQWCSDDLIMASVEFARAHKTHVQMHMLETRYQRIYALKTWGKSFIQHLEEIGALGAWLTLAHMVYADEDDFGLLAERGVGVAHNPSSNLRLRSGIAPVAIMLEAGVKVGVGLDGHGLDDDQDYWRELRLAWVLGNQPGAESLPLSAAQVLQMGTTTGAAITLGSDVPLGQLRSGYLADLVLIDWAKAQSLWSPPIDAIPDLLLHRASQKHVAHLMINGQWVLRDGVCITLDEAAISADIRAALRHQPDAARQQAQHVAESLAPYLRRFYRSWENVTTA